MLRSFLGSPLRSINFTIFFFKRYGSNTKTWGFLRGIIGWGCLVLVLRHLGGFSGLTWMVLKDYEEGIKKGKK